MLGIIIMFLLNLVHQIFAVTTFTNITSIVLATTVSILVISMRSFAKAIITGRVTCTNYQRCNVMTKVNIKCKHISNMVFDGFMHSKFERVKIVTNTRLLI